MSDWQDWEGAADELRARAGLELDEACGPIALARRLGLRVEEVSGMLGLGALVRVHDERRIMVRRGLPPAIRSWVVGHELAHFVRGSTCGWNGRDDEERACHYIGAALQMPRRVFAAATREGGTWAMLAERFKTTETAAAMRFGEVRGEPLAVVCPHRVYARGPEEWIWPDEPTIRQWARSPRNRSGIAVSRLSDPRRFLVQAVR
jgi:IrrE N-terminal-like domain